MPKERFERLRKIDFPFEASPQALGVDLGTGPRRESTTERIGDAPAAPDIATSSAAMVMPQTCCSSSNFTIKRQKAAEEDDDGDDENDEEEAETEDDVTEADDSGDTDQCEDYESFAASDTKGASETTGRERRKERRKSTGSASPDSTAAEVTPDGAVSCSVFFYVEVAEHGDNHKSGGREKLVL